MSFFFKQTLGLIWTVPYYCTLKTKIQTSGKILDKLWHTEIEGNITSLKTEIKPLCKFKIISLSIFTHNLYLSDIYLKCHYVFRYICQRYQSFLLFRFRTSKIQFFRWARWQQKHKPMVLLRINDNLIISLKKNIWLIFYTHLYKEISSKKITKQYLIYFVF